MTGKKAPPKPTVKKEIKTSKNSPVKTKAATARQPSESRKVQPAPKKGTISTAKIKRAVASVSPSKKK